MNPTLVILAAGMASRYGSMKQTQSFGPSGETIMDYSMYDAIESGFKPSSSPSSKAALKQIMYIKSWMHLSATIPYPPTA